MDWISRLNTAAPSTRDNTEIYGWHYAAHLADNVAHRHTFFEVCLVGAHGRGVFTIEGEPLPIASGDLFIARPGVVHRIQNLGAPNMEIFWVSLGWSDPAPRHSSESGNRELRDLWRAFAHSSVVIARDDGLLLELWNTLRATAQAPQHAGRGAQLGALQQALLLQIAVMGAGETAPDAALPAPTPHRLARLGARYIHDNLARKISVAEIAAHLHLSPRHFQRVFAEFTDVAPSVYIEAARIDRARHLLRATRDPIKVIAGAVGLPDVHHFTRVFGKCCGISPAAYRALPQEDVRIVHKEGALV